MNKLFAILVSLWLLTAGAVAQKSHPQKQVLRLVASTPLPGVEGDFDHFAADVKHDRLFLAGEDHKTVEVFNLHSGKHLHSITGFGVPHSVLYVPETNQLMVTDGGDGSCKVLDGTTYKVVDSIKLNLDADSIAYDPKNHLLYVDNGGKDAKMDYSVISIIDTINAKHLGDIRVESNRLEAMAIESSGSRIFVNITGKAQIGVIDRDKKTIVATWDVPAAQENVPMALDEANHRLFITTRKPPKMIVFDTESGKPVATLPASGRADDMVFDAKHKRIYVAAGEGFVNVYAERDPDHYDVVGKVPTGPVAKIGTYVPDVNRLYIAVSAKGKAPAKVMIFSAQP